MAETITSPLLECREMTDCQNNKLFNYSTSNSPAAPQLTAAPCTRAMLSSCSPAGFLLVRNMVESPPAGDLVPPCCSVSLPSRKDPSVLLDSCSSNKENHFRERSFSEQGDRLWSSSQVYVGGGSQVNLSRYKTELCRPFEDKGTCKYGDKCQFAHGMHELRCLSRHPKYKTELCRTFHTIGFCPYGPRCHFIHNANERHGPPPLCAFNKMERPRLQHSVSFAGFSSSSRNQDSPNSVTPPPVLSTQNLMEWQSNTVAHSNLELTSLTPPSPCCFQPTPQSSLSPADSLSDQEGYQSSLGSQSGSESPILDASRRLPIFSRLSVSDY